MLVEALVILASSTACMYCPRRLIALTSAAMTVFIGAPGGSGGLLIGDSGTFSL
ncbi:hypothetical protein A2U01_0102306, partial [Trifolium medium]|nr:hypothetical protein [Trifolium medium]